MSPYFHAPLAMGNHSTTRDVASRSAGLLFYRYYVPIQVRPSDRTSLVLGRGAGYRNIIRNLDKAAITLFAVDSTHHCAPSCYYLMETDAPLTSSMLWVRADISRYSLSSGTVARTQHPGVIKICRFTQRTGYGSNYNPWVV